jgi:ribosomal protein L11 methyltransferase
MGDYIQLLFENTSREEQEILIAQLYELGFEGFEEGHHYLSAYTPIEQFDEKAIEAITLNKSFTATKSIIKQKNWNEEWEKNFEPVVIDNFCAVRAHFHKPIQDVKYEIIITPKMSFGTGHHATTWLMIRFIEQMDLKGKSVLDFGTGTGVLGILAEKAGAANIVALDNDDWSIQNAQENILVNHCTKIDLHKANSIKKTGVFNMILANINKHVLLSNMAEIRQHLTPRGVVILSGLLTGDLQDIEFQAQQYQLRIVDQKERNGWIALQLEPLLHK